MKILSKCLLSATAIVLGTVMVYAAYRIYNISHEYSQGKQEYESLREHIRYPQNTDADAAETGSSHSERRKDIPDKYWNIRFPEVDFAALRQINQDIIGWLYCEGTQIDYPVVQGKNNSEYLRKTFDGKRNASGCLFLDAENNPDMTDFNSIIYGHHMRNGAMFHDLEYYKKQDFYNEHPYMLFVTPEKKYVVEIIAGFVSGAKEDSWRTAFETDEEKEEWIKGKLKRSTFTSDTVPNSADSIITLSTCSYEYSNARLVIFGKLVPIC